MMRAFLRHILTGPDNYTYELLRVMGCLGILGFIVFSGMALVMRMGWSPLEYGSGLAMCMGGVSGGVALKERMEKPPQAGTTTTATATTRTVGADA